MSYQDYIRTITNMGALAPQPQATPQPRQQQPQQMPPMPMQQQMPGQQKKLDPAKSYMKALAQVQQMHAAKGITRGQGALGAISDEENKLLERQQSQNLQRSMGSGSISDEEFKAYQRAVTPQSFLKNLNAKAGGA